MKKPPSEKEALLHKLKKIGDLSLAHCSHVDDDIKQSAIDINRLAHDSYELIKRKKD